MLKNAERHLKSPGQMADVLADTFTRTIAEARVGLTNMGTTPIRAAGVEQALRAPLRALRSRSRSSQSTTFTAI